MRKHLFIAFLGVWVAIVPFLPIQAGSTQTAIFTLSGLLIGILSLLSLRGGNE